MAIQMYLIQPKDNENDGARELIAEFITGRQGFILMATSYGSLIAAFDEIHLDAIKAHYLVDFVGGVQLNPQAPGATALQRVFAENVALQLVERQQAGPSTRLPGAQPSSESSPYPPGYRPLRWARHVADEEGGD